MLSVDENTSIQALDRTKPLLPIDFGATEQRTHDYKRHGTTNLFAALNIATGEDFCECRPARGDTDFLAFLRKALVSYAGKEIHVVLDHLSTHTTPAVKAWLADNPRVSFHLTTDRFVVDERDRDLIRAHQPQGHPPQRTPAAALPELGDGDQRPAANTSGRSQQVTSTASTSRPSAARGSDTAVSAVRYRFTSTRPRASAA